MLNAYSESDIYILLHISTPFGWQKENVSFPVRSRISYKEYLDLKDTRRDLNNCIKLNY